MSTEEKSTSNTSKTKQQQKKPTVPPTFKEMCAFWGGISYFVGVPIYTAITSSYASKETNEKLDNFFTPANSIPRFLVNGVQFILRTGTVAAAVAIGGAVSTVASVLLGGGGVAYCILSSPNYDFATLLKKPSILGLFGAGIPIGMFGLWPRAYFNGFNAAGASQFAVNGPNFIYAVSIALGATSFFVMGEGVKRDNKLEEEQIQNENIKKNSLASISDSIEAQVGNATIGTVTTTDSDGKSSTSDISVKDALNFAKAVKSATDDDEKNAKVNRWLARPQNGFYMASRVLWGVTYGFLLRSFFEVFRFSVWPLISAVIFGSESDLVTFWFCGFRAVNDAMVLRGQLYKEAMKKAAAECAATK